nr:MAG TPA: hypothetical protein [Caudoviricetes sp.]
MITSLNLVACWLQTRLHQRNRINKRYINILHL